MEALLQQYISKDSVLGLIAVVLVLFIFWSKYGRAIVATLSIGSDIEKIKSDIADIKDKQDSDYRRLSALEETTIRQQSAIDDSKEERRLTTRAMLAVLKGLQEQGCNGQVTRSIRELEDFLNEQAHK